MKSLKESEIIKQTRSEENKQSYAMQVSLYQTAKLRDQNYMGILTNFLESKLSEWRN
jgi:hypothetical protein